ncbi:MAG TPA: NAD(P)H-dependent glycerol-3-phosphate dehydrogenase [Candidatus Paceibacterota bacterium]|nr:NAD(P)H-dependent glycerol-3-phosphate dehydrogenase [Verrucomicrobiota bacterium]HSA00489.1 NAD(P)H-dependent glycerol-3-phosphate dehydrogenase [Candidatus Paceibacterota bacterium]
MKIAVLGTGAWGTALGRLLHQGGHRVVLWSNLPKQLEEIRTTGRNELCLPGIDLPRDWEVETDFETALRDCEGVVMAVPSRPYREVAMRLRDFSGLVVSVTKGIEYESGLTMCGILRQVAPRARVTALSGPTLALEVARGIPTAIVAASEEVEASRQAQEWFHRPTFRVYTSCDVLGVELGGALKNVIAIAAGVCDGLGFGDNSKAALITRAIVEIRRLGVACGAEAETFAGLSGLGDLTVTCFSRLSRNRGFGERLGRGEGIESILATMTAVAEGYPTARSAYQLARKHGVITPIIDEVYAMLYEQKPLDEAVRDLISRESKPEH